MPIIKLTDDEWYKHEAERVLECLKAWLPREGAPVAEIKAKLAASGFGQSNEEWTEIGQRLVAQGVIQIGPG